jgi:hypothetical protein
MQCSFSCVAAPGLFMYIYIYVFIYGLFNDAVSSDYAATAANNELERI